jgi:hypothetical protein
VLFEAGAASNVAFLRAAESVAPSLGITVTAIDVLDASGIERPVEE